MHAKQSASFSSTYKTTVSQGFTAVKCIEKDVIYHFQLCITHKNMTEPNILFEE